MPASVAGFSVFGNTSLHRFQNITFVTFDGSCHQFLFFPENLFQKAEKRMTIVEDALNRDIKPFCPLPDGNHIQCFHADLHKYISFHFQIGSDCMRIISELMFAFAAAPSALFALNAAAIKSDVLCTTHMAHTSGTHEFRLSFIWIMSMTVLRIVSFWLSVHFGKFF